MPQPAPRRLVDFARVTGKVRPEDYVWHLVLRGPGLGRGERLATLALTPGEVARIGRENAGPVVLGDDDALAVGTRELGRALEAERRAWVRRALAAGYVDGYRVELVAERGYRRSLFPGVGLAAMAGTSSGGPA